MTRMIWLACCIGLLSSASAAPLAWKSLSMIMRDQTVSAAAASEMGYAVGLSQGGARVFDINGHVSDSLIDPQFGGRQRIYDLVWWRNWLLVATEGGISIWDAKRHQWVVHLNSTKLGFRQPGAFAMVLRGSELWVGGLGQLALVNLDQKKVTATYELPGVPGRVQAILLLGSSVYVGTESAGVKVFDLSDKSWKGYDHFDGLPDNCVTGLELVGSQVMVGTLRGLGRIDLSLQAASLIDESTIVTYMTQNHGALVLSTLDGLLIFDVVTGKSEKAQFKNNLMPAGDLAFANEKLLTGSDGAGAVLADWPSNILSDAPLQVLPQGFVFTLDPKRLQADDKLLVRLWVPERPRAILALAPMAGTAPEERLVKLPADAVGNLVVEISVERKGSVQETRTLQINRDQIPPSIEVEPVPAFVRTSPYKVRGHITERNASAMEWKPRGGKVVIDSLGNFISALALDTGMNHFELVAKDAAGNEVRYPVQTILDSIPPSVRWTGVDSVSEPRARWSMPYFDAHWKGVTITPTDHVVLTVGDSTLNLVFQDLPAGTSRYHIRAEDEAGNSWEKDFAINYVDTRSRIVHDIARRDTVTLRDTVIKTVNAPCPETAPATKVDTVRVTAKATPVYFVRYSLKKGETLRLVAERFYGDREMFVVIARYNQIEDPEEMCRLPIGRELLIPFWQGFTHGAWNVEQGFSAFQKAVGK